MVQRVKAEGAARSQHAKESQTIALGSLFLGSTCPGEEDSSAPKTMQLQAKRGASSMDPGA